MKMKPMQRTMWFWIATMLLVTLDYVFTLINVSVHGISIEANLLFRKLLIMYGFNGMFIMLCGATIIVSLLWWLISIIISRIKSLKHVDLYVLVFIMCNYILLYTVHIIVIIRTINGGG